MTRGLVVAIVAGLVAASTAFAAGTARFFTDPAGDSGTAPDITAVDLGTDVVEGPVVLWVTTPNRTAMADADGLIVFLDTDLRGDTGSAGSGGADYAIGTDAAGGNLFRWDGTTWAQTAAPTLEAHFDAEEKATRIEIHPRELGGTRGFNFFVAAFDAASDDIAPDGDALWTYALESGPLVLSKARAQATAAKAGKPFALTLVVGREDINELLGQGRVTCSLKLGKAALKPVIAQFVDGAATCGWRLPKTAKGKRLTSKLTVAYGGATVSHSAAATVKK